VTEVPEHLLQRSKSARQRAAGGGGEGGDAPAESAGAGAASTAVEPAAGSEVAPAAAAAVPVVPEKPVPPYVAAALRRPKIPKYALTALAALPVWALVYAGAMVTSAPADPLFDQGQTIYQAKCSGCHNADGSGGTGRNLHEVVQTFPDAEAHHAWIENGSPAAGTPYGAADRPGGQRVSQTGGFGAMPGFKDELTPEQIDAVAYYERVEFGGEAPAAPGAEGAGGTAGGGAGH
jgi:mono/diheme cytochrome c family protein